MKFFSILPAIFLLSLGLLSACKKSNSSKSSDGSSALVGFWTYKEDPAQDYWNQNFLFKSDGSFRAYTALSLADTAAGPALADTANQVVTFGTYTVSGSNVEMTYSEFTIIGMKFTGTLNGAKNILIGNLENNEPGSAQPLVYLTKQ